MVERHPRKWLGGLCRGHKIFILVLLAGLGLSGAYWRADWTPARSRREHINPENSISNRQQ